MRNLGVKGGRIYWYWVLRYWNSEKQTRKEIIIDFDGPFLCSVNFVM